MIIGTAGHIDHGKTSLVRALTGVDTDRLQEEKTRGISIALGYAYTPVVGAGTDGASGSDQLPGSMLGFIDVPGHERFVHTMVAGASGIDFALLVVAADDGVMPQTREHLAILQLLGIRAGAIALSKVDRVDAGRIAAVRAQLQAMLADTPLQSAPVFEVVASDPGDHGVIALHSHLHAVAAAAAIAEETDAARRLFRMPVDRVFTLPGHGTVVTGTVASGQVDSGMTLAVMPQRLPARIRSVHAQNRPARQALAGQRSALNLGGIERDALARGDWIADPQAFDPGNRVDAWMQLLPDSGVRLHDWLPLHVHWGSTDRLAHVLVLQADTTGGDGVWVQLVFDQPVCIASGDRFVARDAQAAHTIGGGVLLDPDAPRRRRRSPQRLAWLAALRQLHAGGDLQPLLELASQGIALQRLSRYTGLKADAVALPDGMHRLHSEHGDWIIADPHWRDLQRRLLQELDTLHDRHPDVPGFDSGRLRRSIAPSLEPGYWKTLIDAMLSTGRLQRNGHWLHAPGRHPQLGPREQALLQQLVAQIDSGQFDPPWVRTLAAQRQQDEQAIRSLLRKGATRGALFQVVPDLFYSRQRIDQLAAIIASLAARHEAIAAAEFRDAVGLGRKRSIQILEFFDRIGYTRRKGDCHYLRGDSGWAAETS